MDLFLHAFWEKNGRLGILFWGKVDFLRDFWEKVDFLQAFRDKVDLLACFFRGKWTFFACSLHVGGTFRAKILKIVIENYEFRDIMI